MTGIRMLMVLVLALIGCERSKSEVSSEPAVKAVVQRVTLVDEVSARGSVRSEKRVELRTDRRVKLAEAKVKDYDSVKRGDVLLVVDTKDSKKKLGEMDSKLKSFKLQFEASRLKVESLRKNFDRKQQLFAKGIIAVADYDKARQEYEVAQTDIKGKEVERERLLKEADEVRSQVDAANFVAPNDGVVSELAIAGSEQELDAGKLVAVVSDPKKLALWALVPETRVAGIKVGQPVELEIDAIAGKAFKGKVVSVGTNPAGGSGGMMKSYLVAASFDAMPSGIREGFQGTLKITFTKRENTLVAPLSAVKYTEDKPFLVPVDALGRPKEPVAVELGLVTDAEAEVLNGIDTGTAIFIQ